VQNFAAIAKRSSEITRGEKINHSKTQVRFRNLSLTGGLKNNIELDSQNCHVEQTAIETA